MNVFSPSGPEAADRLAVSRLDDNGAPCPSGPPRSQPRLDPDMIASAPGAWDAAAGAPARSQRRARPGGSPGPHAPMAASQAGLIAAPRQQLAPALLGAG
jgi:hypothetical protein